MLSYTWYMTLTIVHSTMELSSRKQKQPRQLREELITKSRRNQLFLSVDYSAVLMVSK